jgi:thioredoxin-related protein
MRPSVRRIEETYSGQLDFHVLNIDERSTLDLATKYQVTGIPLIVLLDSQGKEFARLLGYQEESQLRRAVEALLENE